MSDDKPALLLHAAAVEQALEQIRALCDREMAMADTSAERLILARVRAILDAVSVDATPAQGIDPEELLSLLDSAYGSPLAHHQAIAGRILALLRPVEGAVPLQGIDRDALISILSGIASETAATLAAERILALLRPVEGVVLTPGMAGCALAWFDIARQCGYAPDEADRTVVNRLEASS